MTSIFQTYGDARSAALILAQHEGDTIYIFERNGQFLVTGWGGDDEERQGAQFVGRVLPDGTWAPRYDATSDEARAPREGSKEGAKEATVEDSPLAGIELTRKTVNVLNSEADRRGVSREAFRAMAATLMSYDIHILDLAERLIKHHGLTSVRDMAERSW